jgi:hypothetical protein
LTVFCYSWLVGRRFGLEKKVELTGVTVGLVVDNEKENAVTNAGIVVGKIAGVSVCTVTCCVPPQRNPNHLLH